MAPADFRGWACLLLLALIALTAPSAEANECVRCHVSLSDETLSAPARQWLDSAHGSDAIGCIGCHRGDPADPTARAHAADTRFVAKPARREQVAMCGGCHGDARFIRQHNAALPIDQLALFQISRHGRALESGNEAAPTCSACHGLHGILPVEDPRSQVYRGRSAELCGSCHANADSLGDAALPTTQLASYRRRVHAKAVAAGNRSAPTCSTCHGSHGQLGASDGGVGQVCRSCHKDAGATYDRSPHDKPFDRLGLSACVQCHGAHDVAEADPLMVSVGPEGACGRCHARDQKVLGIIDALGAQLRTATTVVDRARGKAEAARAEGLWLNGLDAALVELRTAELLLGPQAHTLDPSALAGPVGEIEAAAARVDELISAARNERERSFRGYYAAAVILLILTALLIAKAIALARRRRPG